MSYDLWDDPPDTLWISSSHSSSPLNHHSTNPVPPVPQEAYIEVLPQEMKSQKAADFVVKVARNRDFT